MNSKLNKEFDGTLIKKQMDLIDKIPQMIVEYPNGTGIETSKKDYEYWLNRCCNKYNSK